MTLGWFLACLLVVALQAVSIALFASGLERREHFGWRVALVAAACAGCAWAVAASGVAATGSSDPRDYVLAFVVFAGIFVAYVPMVLACWRTRPLVALFCCASGYTLQNVSSLLTRLLWKLALLAGAPASEPLHNALFLAVGLGVPWATGRIFLRRMDAGAIERYESEEMPLVAGLAVIVAIGLDQMNKYLGRVVGIPGPCLVFLEALHALLCVAVLVVGYRLVVEKRDTAERVELEQMLERRDDQYRLAHEAVDAVNARMHDIRHRVFALLGNAGAPLDQRTLRELAHTLDVYDSLMHTGNAALDVAVSEKSLACRQAGVDLACVADGAALDALRPADVYSLVAGLLDAGLAECRAVADPELRTMLLQVGRRSGAAVVHLEHYRMGGEDADEGLADARSLAESCGGTLTVTAAGDTRRIDVLLP